MLTRRTALVAVATLPVAGCATLTNFFNSPAGQAAIATAVQVAVGVGLAAAGPGAAALASALATAAQELISLAGGSTTTIGTLVQDAVAKINGTTLNGAIKLALINIVTFAGSMLSAGVAALPAGASGDLAQIFQDILNAANAFSVGVTKPEGRATLQRMGVRI